MSEANAPRKSRSGSPFCSVFDPASGATTVDAAARVLYQANGSRETIGRAAYRKATANEANGSVVVVMAQRHFRASIGYRRLTLAEPICIVAETTFQQFMDRAILRVSDVGANADERRIVEATSVIESIFDRATHFRTERPR